MAFLKCILRYVCGTTSHGLLLRASTDFSVTAYFDADWSGCPDTRIDIRLLCLSRRLPHLMVVEALAHGIVL
jgi:hypothetical protein